jgi:hypothetical protein
MKTLCVLFIFTLFYLPVSRGQKKRSPKKAVYIPLVSLKQLQKKNLSKEKFHSEENPNRPYTLGPPFPTDYNPRKRNFNLNVPIFTDYKIPPN